MHWVKRAQTLTQSMSSLIATHVQTESVDDLSDARYEMLYNTMVTLSALSHDMIQHLNRTRACTPLKKRKRMHGSYPPVEAIVRKDTINKSGYCDGCQHFLTGAQARAWHNCPDATASDTNAYRRLCDACHARYKRLKRRRRRRCRDSDNE